MDDNLDPAHLRQVDAVVYQFEALGVAVALPVGFALETGIAVASFEEVLVGGVQVPETLLQGLTVCFLQPGIRWLLFQAGQVPGTLLVTQPHTGLLVG